VANPFLAQTGGNLYIQGNQSIDILALNHPETPFQSGGSMTLVSDGNVSGDAHFFSGGGFSILNLAGNPGNFVSLYDPIISSEVDFAMGNYTGPALKVETRGSITMGNITITGPDTVNIPILDPDFDLLTTSPALILQAGKPMLDNSPNIATSNDRSIPASIQVGTITTSSNTDGNAGPVILKTNYGNNAGDISFDEIRANALGTGNGGNITIEAGGNISANNLINTNALVTGNGGNITIEAGGNINLGNNVVSTSSNGNSGNITINAPNGTIQVLDVLSTGTNGTGGDITINARGDVGSDDIQSRGSLNGGTITVTSTDGAIDTTATAIDPEGSVASCIILPGPDGFCASGSSGDINLNAGSIRLAGSNPTGTLRGNNITLTSPDIRLTRDIPITATGTLAVNGAITTGNIPVTLDARTITLTGNITTAGGDISFGDIQPGNVELRNDITLDTGGGNITFSGTVDGDPIDGANNLILNAGIGTTTFNGIVGGTTRLNTLRTDAGGTSIINSNLTLISWSSTTA
jgi:hypothetical protein